MESKRSRTEGEHHYNMKSFIFSKMNLKKQNKISTPFRKWIRVELVFHFLPLFCNFFPLFLKEAKNALPIGTREISSVSRD